MGRILPDDRKAHKTMNSITQYINSKFEPYADCQEVQEIREEILLLISSLLMSNQIQISQPSSVVSI